MNRLNVDTLTLDLLAGPTYELMRGSCTSLIELEYHLEEVYKATTDQLDWVNPEGQQYPHNLLQPLPLIPDNQGRRLIPFDHFINNDLEYLRGEPKNANEALGDESWVVAVENTQTMIQWSWELNFFLGLQMKDEIFFNQSKYIKEMFIKFGLEDSKPTKKPISMEIKLTKDDEGDSVDSTINQERVKQTIIVPRTTQKQIKEDPNKLFRDDLHLKFKGWELFLREKIFCILGNRDDVNACTTYMLYYLVINKKFDLTTLIVLRMDYVKRINDDLMPYSMLLTKLFKYILQTNPQSIVPLDSFTYHQHFITMTSSFKTNSPNHKRKTTRIRVKSPTYVNLESSTKEHHNERTSSLPLRKKSLSPSHAPSKSTSSRSTFQTTSSSPSESTIPSRIAPPPKLRFFIPMKLEPQELPSQQTPPHNPHVSTMDNWTLGPSNPSPPHRSYIHHPV
uniref:Retrovirus-related Pol polyprotein from transposon TNT 1-94 n=1 Tax=Tanacetum cinerariifolium TaxID=118510 RepID=A0A6L2LTY2_TANCI|nr:retrovirus-related Pol polyprotein from transposon TNT 1-94 [Tanacetum cinerariifolium]